MESEYGRRFWAIETLEEGRMVARLLRRRFPQVFDSLSEIFEQADPLDIVYPGNPNEYSDVIREIIVLLSPVGGKIGLLAPGQIEELVREGLGRCFDDEPIESRVQDVVRKITAKFKGLYASSEHIGGTPAGRCATPPYLSPTAAVSGPVHNWMWDLIVLGNDRDFYRLQDPSWDHAPLPRSRASHVRFLGRSAGVHRVLRRP